MKRFVLLAVTALALMACDDKKTETKPEDPTSKNSTTSASATPTDTSKTATPAAVTINDSDIATPADFEESAEKSIDKKNYKTELTTLETDISKD